MIALSDLPTVNAVLNFTSAIFLVSGYVLIRKKIVTLHRVCMIGAFTASVLFLISYLVYHFQAGSTKFPGTGTIRTFYFTVLFTHTVLAAFVPFLATMTLVRALKGRFEKHRRIARWTLPIWLYVSVTGVIIYWMLYHL